MALDPPPAGARAGLLGENAPAGGKAPLCGAAPWWLVAPPWAGGGPGALCRTPAHRYFRTPGG